MQITIETVNGPETVPCYRVRGTTGLVVARVTTSHRNARKRRWTLTHAPSGLRIEPSYPRRADALAAGAVIANVIDRNLPAVAIGRMRGLASQLREKLAGHWPADRPATRPGPAPATIKLAVRNRHSGETRELTLTEEEAARAVYDSVNRCTGPCECEPIEPDAVCPHGWPAIEQAIIMHAR
jgi:hypothetical protein